MNTLFVGIDVSSRSNVVYLMNPDGSKYSSFSVQNNLGGAELLSEKIVSALSSMQLSNVVIGLEATFIYGDSLVYALQEDGSLGRFQRKIHILNPEQGKKIKVAYPDLPKKEAAACQSFILKMFRYGSRQGYSEYQCHHHCTYGAL